MGRPDYQKRIEARISEIPEREAFVVSDFPDIMDTQAVNKALSLLAEAGTIRRVLRGVYDRSQYGEPLKE